jgi:glutamine amidotransferase
MKLVIIDYGSGNLKSVENAFQNSIKDNDLNFNIEVTSELKTIIKSDLIILPGVGAFPDCKEGLKKKQRFNGNVN